MNCIMCGLGIIGFINQGSDKIIDQRGEIHGVRFTPPGVPEGNAGWAHTWCAYREIEYVTGKETA